MQMIGCTKAHIGPFRQVRTHSSRGLDTFFAMHGIDGCNQHPDGRKCWVADARNFSRWSGMPTLRITRSVYAPPAKGVDSSKFQVQHPDTSPHHGLATKHGGGWGGQQRDCVCESIDLPNPRRIIGFAAMGVALLP
jgi:hypothetical protein